MFAFGGLYLCQKVEQFIPFQIALSLVILDQLYVLMCLLLDANLLMCQIPKAAPNIMLIHQLVNDVEIMVLNKQDEVISEANAELLRLGVVMEGQLQFVAEWSPLECVR